MTTTTTEAADAGTNSYAVTADDLHRMLTDYCRRIPGLSADEVRALEQIVDASVHDRGTWPSADRVPHAALVDLMIYTRQRCPGFRA